MKIDSDLNCIVGQSFPMLVDHLSMQLLNLSLSTQNQQSSLKLINELSMSIRDFANMLRLIYVLLERCIAMKGIHLLFRYEINLFEQSIF